MIEEATPATSAEGGDAIAPDPKPKRSRRKPTTGAPKPKKKASPPQVEHKYPKTKGPTCAVCGAPLSSAITKGELACPYGHPQPEQPED